VPTRADKKSSDLLDKEREQEPIKIKVENESPSVTTPNLSTIQPSAHGQLTDSLKSSRLAATNADFNYAMKTWDDHLGKIKSPSQLHSIYNKWSMTKLEVVAKSVFTAYKLRQQNEDAELLAQGVEKREVGSLSRKNSFNKKEQEDFKRTSFSTEMALLQTGSLPCVSEVRAGEERLRFVAELQNVQRGR